MQKAGANSAGPAPGRLYGSPVRPIRLLLLCSLCWLAACEPDPGRLTLRDVDRYTPALLQEALEPSWAHGRVNHAVLKGHHRDALELFAEHLNAHGPRTRPALFRFPRQRLAFYTNAHNGLALLAWLRAGSADGDPQRRWNPAWSTQPHAIDGQQLSLDDLAARVRAEGGRVSELLLSRGRRDGPELAAVPFHGQTYEAERGAQLRFLLNRERAFTDTTGAVVGPAWLRTLLEPSPEQDAAPRNAPMDAAALASFLGTHLAYEHPLRLEVLRAAREGRLVPDRPDPRIALPPR